MQKEVNIQNDLVSGTYRDSSKPINGHIIKVPTSAEQPYNETFETLGEIIKATLQIKKCSLRAVEKKKFLQTLQS